MQLSATDRDRMKELAAKNQAGELTAAEERELEIYCRVGRMLDLLSAKARLALQEKPSPILQAFEGDPAQTSWLEKAMPALLPLADLPQDWDSYGSRPVQGAALIGAIRLLIHAAAEMPPLPNIGPVPGGGLQLEWQINGRELELEVLPNGAVEYLTVQGQNLAEGSLRDAGDDQVRSMVRWVLQG